MISQLIPIAALLAGIALLLLGTGLLNTLIALRGGLAGFSDETLGLIGSTYFIGFFVGTYVAPVLIRRMGHVRAFAFFAAAVAGCVLAHSLLVAPWFWMLLRVLTGIALVGFYMVIESWLNSESPREHRAQIFSVYMTVNLFALAGAQQFLRFGSPATFTLFAIAAIFVVVSLMPVVATRLPPPTLTAMPRPALQRLWRAAPVAFVGALASGLAMGAFWSMSPVYAANIGLDDNGVALLITVTILSGALLQWPMGRLSDSADRRRALALISATAAAGGLLMAALGAFGQWLLLGAFIFGGAAFAVYPVVVAHLIDHLEHEEILSGNAGLLLLHGLGAAVGPALVGFVMSATGPVALPLFFTVTFGPAALFALLYSRRGADEIVGEAAHFMPMLRTSSAVLEMMTPDQAAPEHPATAPEPPLAASAPSEAPPPGASP